MQKKIIAWRLCSEYNRRKEANIKGLVGCATCFTVAHWYDGNKMDAGHFLAKSKYPVIEYHHLGIWSQCKVCNIINRDSLRVAEAYKLFINLKSWELDIDIKQTLLHYNYENRLKRENLRHEEAIEYYTNKLKELN